MEICVLEKRTLSSDGVHRLSGKVYWPEGEPKGLFQVVHGMTEHIDRYDWFMREMACEGYVCFGYDHLGHGRTAGSDSELGFIAHRDGWQRLCEDVALYADSVREDVAADLPYFLMGHSMGSFVVRVAVKEGLVSPDKLIVMGTGGPNPASSAGMILLKVLKRIYGEYHTSALAESLIFGGYNKRFGKADPYNWLTKDEEVRRIYGEDPYCTFHFTVSALQDLIRLNMEANCGKWFRDMRKDLPVLLVAGKEDPVGNYGKGVQQVYQKLQDAGCDATMTLYENCRHEILKDTCREAVLRDILTFAESGIQVK